MLNCTRLIRSDRFRRSLIGVSVALVAIAMVNGCGSKRSSSAGTGASYDTPRRSIQGGINHDEYARLGYRLVWQGFPVLGDSSSVRFFDVFDEGIVVHSMSNSITFMELTTGANRWVRQIGQPLETFVGNTTDNSQLMVASDNELFILDPRTGEITDKHGLAVVVSTPPRVIWPIVVFGSGGGEVLGHNLQTGFKLWGYKLRGSITARPVRIGQDLAGVVSQNGDTIIIDTRTGSSTMRARIFGGLSNVPVASDDAMYVASLDQSIYGFATRGSSWDWRVRAQQPLSSQPALLDDVLYVDIPGEGFAALDPAYGGERIWTSEDVSGVLVGMQNEELIVFSRERQKAYRIDPERGDITATIELNNVERMRMVPNVDGDLFAVSPQGVVGKFTPRF